ncbi:uncharacterized protein LOC144927458 [Branchiostoma floridae x Branchiostoma belcheri]
MFPASILDHGLGVMTDPARLHAELWGDHISKVISCWLPVLMSTVLVGRGLLGSSIQCFPLDLVHVLVQPQNGTFMSDGNSTSNAFSGVSSYTRQLSDFVNSYCAGKSSYPENTVFNSYQFFAMMLVVQAGLMYVPFLIWNVTKGKEVISIVRFIAHDMEVLYDRFRKQNTQDQVLVLQGQVQSGGQGEGAQGGAQGQGQAGGQGVGAQEGAQVLHIELKGQVQAGGQGVGAQEGAQGQGQAGGQGVGAQGGAQGQGQAGGQGVGAQGDVQKNAQQQVVYGQEELVAAEKQWKAEYTTYKWYVIKQVVSIVISVGFLLYHSIQLKSIDNIKDTFPCSVEEKFSVTCTVPTAAVHKFIWVTNMILLVMTVLIILINVVILHKGAEEYPFAEIGIEKPKATQGAQGQNTTPKEAQSQGANEGHAIESNTGTGNEDSNQAEAQRFVERQDKSKEAQSSRIQCPHFNDSCLMHAFFKANIESVEKYNYVKNLLKVAPDLELPDAQKKQTSGSSGNLT